jgi:transcriptional regulator with XRE-family HTH domain
MAHEKLTKDERKVVGGNILKVLQTRDMSVAELARYLDVHRTYMSKMLHGKVSFGDNLDSISKKLDTPIDELLGKDFSPVRESSLPFGPLDGSGRQSVPGGCVIQRIPEKCDAHPSAGRWVLLGPKGQKPPSGSLVWCELLNQTIFVRQYVADQLDPRRFVLTNNVAGDGLVALDHSQVADLRVIAIPNLKLGE